MLFLAVTGGIGLTASTAGHRLASLPGCYSVQLAAVFVAILSLLIMH